MPNCAACSIDVERRHWVGHLRSNDHKNKCSSQVRNGIFEIASSAFRGRIVSYRLFADEDFKYCLPEIFLNGISSDVQNLLQDSLRKHVSIKVNFELFCTFLLFQNDAQEIKSFATRNLTIHPNYNFNETFENSVNYIKKKISEFQERDSGWTLLNNSHVEININKYDPLNGSTFIDLPPQIKNKKACLNIENKDKCCFLWCIVAALYPVKKNRNRTTSYPHYSDVLNIEGMFFPVSMSDIKLFERNNSTISINVYSLQNNKTLVGPIYRSEYKRKNRINLLLLERGNKSHYVVILDLPRLVRRQMTKHHGKLFFCEDCLLFFQSEPMITDHICGGVATFLPSKGSVMQFKNFSRKQDIPFVVYADFETLLLPYQSCEPNPSVSYTLNSKRHVAAAFAYHVVCSFDRTLNRFVQYRGRDCVKKFIQSLFEDINAIYKILNKEIPMIFTDEDAKVHLQSDRCHICNHLLFFDKVRDHDHLTGLYRGAAHSYCNLNYRVPKLVPVFFHNLAGYDSHLFIKELGEHSGSIKIIPKTKENYISFTKFLKISDYEYAQIRFVDSYKFLGTSLEKLAQGIDKKDFYYLAQHFSEDNKFRLLTRKGIYPYDYITSWESYNENHLPSKHHFYNALNDVNISDEDYNHAQSVWYTFNIKNIGEYTDLYVKTDVLLLSDIFENFRKTCKTHYYLDPAFYLTAPGLSFDAMLLKTGVQLELIDNLEILRMIQKGIRGGICHCSKRYAKANNIYTDSYDPSKINSFIVYIDCNNLYGYSMCQSLPVSNFRFLSNAEIESLNIKEVPDDAEYGFILEVDLVYPKKLHNWHNDYPFCAEKFIPPGSTTSKLITNLYDKYEYVIHYVHLKTCLLNGLLLTKIHRVITFKQSAFLKEYIDLNTSLRKNAKTPFEQDLFKLLNNSIFGKTLEDSEKRVDVKLVNQWCQKNNKTKKNCCANKLIARPNFHSASIFSENLVAIQMRPEKIILDKPIYIGFTVLELSKSHMFNFHYSIIKPKYGESVELCYTDTDSFVYNIQTENFYIDLKRSFLNYFDTSNYDLDNPFQIPIINKKVPGLFKDELGGEIITEFVGLRSKLYCIKTDKFTIKKAKGVKKNVVRDLFCSDYYDVLVNDRIIRKKNLLFKSIKHEIYTQSVNKVALSNTDDKRQILGNKTSTRAWGHRLIL